MGTWVFSALPDCAETVTNGQTLSATGDGGTATPSCDPGYTLSSTDVLTCTDGTFTPAVPTCDGTPFRCCVVWISHRVIEGSTF